MPRGPGVLQALLQERLRWVGERTEPDVRADPTGRWRDGEVLAQLGPALTELFPEESPTVIVGPQSRGSLLGALLGSGERVLFVDDWVATGAQVEAAHELVERSGTTWVGAAVVVDGAERGHVRRTVNLARQAAVVHQRSSSASAACSSVGPHHQRNSVCGPESSSRHSSRHAERWRAA